MICRLCLRTEATQTGSHLLSAFLVESMIGERGKEKSFLIEAKSGFDYVKNVRAQPLMEDYLICTGCEKRLSYVESIVSQEFLQKFFREEQRVNFISQSFDLYKLVKCQRLDSGVFFLFIASLIWRVSVTKKEVFRTFRLKSHQEELLRLALDRLLPPYSDFKVKPNKKAWLRLLSHSLLEFPLFSFKLITSEVRSNNPANLVLARTPPFYLYSLLLNEYLVLIKFDWDFSVKSSPIDFFKLGQIFSASQSRNNPGHPILIQTIPEPRWREITTVVNEALVSQATHYLNAKYSLEFY